jgi:hypothetical protein
MLELTVDSLAYAGNRVAPRDGYTEVRAGEVVAPSPDRVPPLADHSGAPWQVLPMSASWRVKASQVDEADVALARHPRGAAKRLASRWVPFGWRSALGAGARDRRHGGAARRALQATPCGRYPGRW